MRRRVVVTGLGMVTAIGNNAQDTWNSLVAGVSGVRKIADFPVDNLPCKIAASVRYKSELDPNGFDPLLYVEPKDLRKMGHFILLGIAAADEAVRDAGWFPELEHEREQTAVVVGSGVGGLPVIEETAVKLKDFGFKKVSPFFIPSTLSNLLPGNISIRYNYYGPNLAVTTACASGAHAVGEGAAMIRAGRANVVIAGGAEGVVSPIAVAGFAAGRALSTKFNDTPHLASRPWDRDRDGFVIGEGAGMLVLEDYDHASKRGAKIYAELLGYGASGDAFHITAPPSDGSGARRSMRAALRDAGIEADDIDYINAHGTSTPVGDEAELEAVMGLFNLDNRKRKLYMSSIKSSIGHLLGAAGGVEAVVSVMALQKKALPPTLNLHNPIVSHEKLDLVPNVAKEVDVRVILSNSFGFGGTNASLIFAKHG